MDNTQIEKAKQNMTSLLQGDRFQKDLQMVLPKHLTPDRIVKIALVAMSRQPKLFGCTPQSILQSVMKSAELGLDCVGTLGQGYLVPYWNGKISALECQFIPGYQGLVTLARRSGYVTDIDAQVVYDKDAFDIEFGTNRHLFHKPHLGDDRGEVKGAYAIAYFPNNGGTKFDYMSRTELEKIKNLSKSKDKKGNLVGPWVEFEDEMNRKCPVRRLAKYLPLSPEDKLAKAFEADNQQFNLESLHETVGTLEAGIDGVKKRIAANAKKVEAKEIDSKPLGDEKNPETKAKAQEQIEKLQEAPSEDNIPDPFPWHCNACGKDFTAPKKGAKNAKLCEFCLSENIVRQEERKPVPK